MSQDVVTHFFSATTLLSVLVAVRPVLVAFVQTLPELIRAVTDLYIWVQVIRAWVKEKRHHDDDV